MAVSGVSTGPKRKRTWRTWLVAIAAVLAVAGGALWWMLLGRNDPDPPMTDRDLFAYGSVGAEGQALPLYIWEALPDVCPDALPGGYQSIGFLYEPHHETPVGIATRRLGVPRASFTCAICHSGSFRTAPDASRHIVLGMPGHQMDLQRFTRFALGCLSSPSFTGDRVMAAIARHTALSATDRVLYRYVLVPALQFQVKSLKAQFAWFDERPEFGPGRFDGFAPYKNMSVDHTVATADIMSVWNQGLRGTRGRHWDGNTNSTIDGAIASALGFGATASSVNIAALERVSRYFRTLPPPPFPFPVDQGLAAKGAAVFGAACGSCHQPGGERFGSVMPVAEIGTDTARHEAFTEEAVRTMNQLGAGYPWQIHTYRTTAGYQADLLDGIWARAPYLHNGAVPTLDDLLKPAGQRPPTFYRGYDVYDPAQVGFISAGPNAEREGRRFDVSQPGNGNAGHEYGTTLPEPDRRALLEYLKTL